MMLGKPVCAAPGDGPKPSRDTEQHSGSPWGSSLAPCPRAQHLVLGFPLPCRAASLLSSSFLSPR